MFMKIKSKKIAHMLTLVGLIVITFYVYTYDAVDTPIFDSSEKIVYRFWDHFEEAKITGNIATSDNPWGNTVAKIKIADEDKNDPYIDRKAIFALPTSELTYDVTIPEKEKTVFRATVGVHPLASAWGGDGFRAKVDVVSDGMLKNVLDEYIMPKDGLKELNVKLYKYRGKKIELKLSISNDGGKNSVGDWAVWVDPQLVVK